MKQIAAVIQPHMLSRVEHALHELSEPPGFTPLRANDHGRSAPQVVDAIRRSAHTGLPGDGIIAVSEALEVIHIGGGELGAAAPAGAHAK